MQNIVAIRELMSHSATATFITVACTMAMVLLLFLKSDSPLRVCANTFQDFFFQFIFPRFAQVVQPKRRDFV